MAKGDEMVVTVQTQFESVVTQMYEEAFAGSSIENGTTVIKFDLRKLDFQRECRITSTIYWRKDMALIIGSATFGHPRRVRKKKNPINAIISNS